MVLKLTLYEFCQECGERLAEVRDGRVHTGTLNCKCDQPPGPPDPPRSFSLGQVNLIRNKKDRSIQESTAHDQKVIDFFEDVELEDDEDESIVDWEDGK